MARDRPVTEGNICKAELEGQKAGSTRMGQENENLPRTPSNPWQGLESSAQHMNWGFQPLHLDFKG